MKITSLKYIFFASGWLAFALLSWHYKDSLYGKISTRLSGNKEKTTWNQLVVEKTRDLAETPWMDTRPSVIILGDSRVEMANWYDLFQGSFAIRNGGLSQARIGDVSCLADSISAIRPSFVILQCGINDLASGTTVEKSYDEYLDLIAKITKSVNQDKLIIVSVIPVETFRFSGNGSQLNRKVGDLNIRLRKYCLKLGITFVDASPAIAEGSGLQPGLTWDGMHLKSHGYQRLVTLLKPLLHRKHADLEQR